MFNFRKQATDLGNYLDAFATLAKALNGYMLRRSDTQGHIDQIIGTGRYNRAVTEMPTGPVRSIDEATVLYGDALRRERRDNSGHHGLFAAITAIHHPLLAVAQNLMNDLGKQGFTYQASCEGKTVSIPLGELKIDFNDQGAIFTTSKWTGQGATLPESTVIMSGGYAEFNGAHINGGRKISGSIMDKDNKPLNDDLFARLLWTVIAGKGKNIYDPKSAKNTVLMQMGIDDMDEANEYLIHVVTSLSDSHGYDPEPLWTRAMESAREKLEPHLPVLALTRAAIANSPLTRGMGMMEERALSSYNVDTIDNVARFFGFTLPALAEQEQAIALKVANCAAAR